MHTILNFNRVDAERNEIFTSTIAENATLTESHSKLPNNQVSSDEAQAALYLFEKNASYSKPLVADRDFKAMSAAKKASNCTIDLNAYVIEGEFEGETTIEDLRPNYRVWKVIGFENKKLGSKLAIHIKVLLK